MKKPELLAPVGDKESLKAAISAGCDAVYLAGKKFGARSYAPNFSNEELIEAINYAHIYGVKVYVTVNTIIYENEVNSFLEFVRFIHKNNVDALIIQDIGMIDLLRKKFPNLELHASTQMNIHNIEGAKLLENLGLKRVVLARETDIDLIKKIKENTSIELEVFIQGALCISYSGQCLMSSLIGNRSGNRGSCTQCCRMPYDLISNQKKINKDKYLLSSKDLNTLENLDKILDIGIDSLKIEGRMKRPEYVYLMVSIYRKAIDNYYSNKQLFNNSDFLEMQKIFNRGFTKGFIFNEKNNNFVNQKRPNHMGIEIGEVLSYSKGKVKIKLNYNLSKGDGIRIVSKEDYGFNVNKIYQNNKVCDYVEKGIIELSINKPIKSGIVLKTTDIKQIDKIQKAINNDKKIVLEGFIKAHLNQPFVLKITDGVNEITLEEDIIEKSINQATSKDRIIKQINKLGDTPFIFKNIDYDIDDNIFIKIIDLNNIRRKITNLLISKYLYKNSFLEKEYTIELNDFKKENNYNIFIDELSIYEKIKDFKFQNLYLKKNLFSQIKDSRKILRLDRINFTLKENLDNSLIGDFGSLLKYKDVITDFNFNVTNSYSVALLHSLGVKRVTLSYELNDLQIKDIIDNYHNRYHKHPNLEIIVLSYPEVMISKFNLLKYYKVEEGYLKDKYNNLFKIKEENGLMTIYHYEKIINSGDYFKMGINNLRFHIIDIDDINFFKNYTKKSKI